MSRKLWLIVGGRYRIESTEVPHKIGLDQSSEGLPFGPVAEAIDCYQQTSVVKDVSVPLCPILGPRKGCFGRNRVDEIDAAQDCKDWPSELGCSEMNISHVGTP